MGEQKRKQAFDLKEINTPFLWKTDDFTTFQCNIHSINRIKIGTNTMSTKKPLKVAKKDEFHHTIVE